ncbi:EthD domain-containing protein [Aspergillus foveolatus]|uniref:EthD domain-containing protein n=1 Tax=Aspergillus foveolatus TaxID=210207 RepID=UPI003CCD7F1B
MAELLQKKRLLCMKVAHYRQPDVNEEDFYRWVTEQHAARAAKLHAKNGIEEFPIVFTPKSFRDFTSELNTMRGSPWRIRDFDAQVEFFFRDMETFYKGAADADFQALQAEEGPFIGGEGAEISIGWVETYVRDEKVVNLDDSGKPTFPSFKNMSRAP